MDSVAASVGAASWLSGSSPDFLLPEAVCFAGQLPLLGSLMVAQIPTPLREQEEIPSMPSLLELESHMTSSCNLYVYP